MVLGLCTSEQQSILCLWITLSNRIFHLGETPQGGSGRGSRSDVIMAARRRLLGSVNLIVGLCRSDQLSKVTLVVLATVFNDCIV
jgi:hypothetical protein